MSWVFPHSLLRIMHTEKRSQAGGILLSKSVPTRILGRRSSVANGWHRCPCTTATHLATSYQRTRRCESQKSPFSPARVCLSTSVKKEFRSLSAISSIGEQISDKPPDCWIVMLSPSRPSYCIVHQLSLRASPLVYSADFLLHC